MYPKAVMCSLFIESLKRRENLQVRSRPDFLANVRVRPCCTGGRGEHEEVQMTATRSWRMRVQAPVASKNNFKAHLPHSDSGGG